MKIFPFKKKRKVATEIERFCAFLDRNPEDVESRLKLAHLYRRVGAQKSAMREYRTAARQLNAEGLDLEAIATYRQILGLDHIFPDEESREAAQEAEDLLIRVKEVYERLLVERSPEMDPPESSDIPHRRPQLRDDGANREEMTGTRDDEPVPIETLVDSSSDREDLQGSPNEKSDRNLLSSDTSPLEGISQAFPGALNEDTSGLLSEEEIPPRTDLSSGEGHWELKTGGEEGVEDSKTPASGMTSDSETSNRLRPILFDDPLEVDFLTTTSQGEEREPDQASSMRRTTETPPGLPDQRESALHYSLGIACYETNCVDEAIKEFVKAHNQGGNPVDSLSMLAKCYYRKGLFLNSAGFVYQALRRDNLTKEQIDMLQTQLGQIKIRAV